MNISLYLENDSLKNLLENSDEEICKVIEKIDEVVKNSQEAGDNLNKRLDFYYVNIDDETELCEWIYDNSNAYSELQDYKKIMLKFIEQCRTVDDDIYNNVKENISNEYYYNPDAFISICTESATEWNITNINKWSKVHRYYLNSAENIDQFMNGIEYCFLNLHFHPGVRDTLRTLSYPFKDYKDEIICHLEALNDRFPLVYSENKERGYQEVSDIFKAETSIDCSPERKRKTIRNRVFNFVTEAREELAVTCELHTKFAKFRKDKDRLYFHPGNKQIIGEKILIAYIGKHLD